ncbi:hypothetical protein K505DRAFT_296979 [Melanomma pulvis-pyrius CBS 109.77]|uniref:Uncharacterized protein n=1 Tax=Melanomma pulvis-pyrius CBS 109.77 TaxID=1314802 RepID=A0A6A6XPA3_9PLEO|nr:hypothetical protein K505DRAFT_296979 [Melanomma pulvis-pyrius CBS 109.77]
MTSKADIIDERKANLPLPDQPPVASDWNSLDARNVNVDANASRKEDLSHDTLRDPNSGPVGREAKDNLEGLPNDAVTREKKGNKGLADTTGKDYGYPEKSDPSEGLKK